MAGIWLIVVPVALLVMMPLEAACLAAAESGSERRCHLWFGSVTAALALVAVAASALAMQLALP